MAFLAPGRWPSRLGILLLTVASTLQASADNPSLDEYQVKAAFLFNFAKFVDWPANAPNSSKDAVVLCILGRNPFGEALDGLRGKMIGPKKFEIREVTKVDQARMCHILFIAASERKRTASVLDQLKGDGILTVGETDDFLEDGGIVAFRLSQDRVRFEIDSKAAEHARLSISSKLLSLGVRAKK